jgi:hypothetical protein
MGQRCKLIFYLDEYDITHDFSIMPPILSMVLPSSLALMGTFVVLLTRLES